MQKKTPTSDKPFLTLFPKYSKEQILALLKRSYSTYLNSGASATTVVRTASSFIKVPSFKKVAVTRKFSSINTPAYTSIIYHWGKSAHFNQLPLEIDIFERNLPTSILNNPLNLVKKGWKIARSYV